MILLAGLLALQAHRPVQVEVGNSNEVVLSVAAPLPRLGSKDRGLLAVAVDALSKGSQVYPPSIVRTVTEGRGIRCRLLADEALVTVSVPKTGAGAGLDLIISLITEPSFLQEDLDASLARIGNRPAGYWASAMREVSPPLKEAPRDQVMQVFGRVFRRDRVVMAYGGPIGDVDVAGKWTFRTADWTPAPEPRYPDYDLVPASAANAGHVTTAVLAGPEIGTGNASLPSRLLALYALGSGKGASLYRISRQRHAWSYRQEAYLWPTGSGWEPRLLVAMLPTADAATRIETLQKELGADIDAWNEDDRLRALGMAESTLLRGLPYGPILLGDDPLEQTPEDQVTMAAYWEAKTGAEWDPQVLYQNLLKISLSELKTAAHSILDPAKAVIVPGTASR